MLLTVLTVLFLLMLIWFGVPLVDAGGWDVRLVRGLEWCRPCLST